MIRGKQLLLLFHARFFVDKMLSALRLISRLRTTSCPLNNIRTIAKFEVTSKDRSTRLTNDISNVKYFASNENDFLLSVVNRGNSMALDYSLKKHPLVAMLIDVIRSRNTMEGEEVAELIKELNEERSELSDDDIIFIMDALTSLPFLAREANFFELCKIVEGIASSRSGQKDSKFKDTDFVWEVVVLLYKLSMTRLSPFVMNVVSNWLKYVHGMSKENFLRLLFLVNARRTQLTEAQTKQIQDKFLQCIPNMETAEVAVASLAFFKTQSKITDPALITSMLNKLSKDLKNVDSLVLSGILKNLKYGHVGNISTQVRKFISCFKKNQVLDMNYMTANHLLSVSCNYLTFNKNITEAALQLITEKPHGEVRLKDLVEVIRCCHEFNYKPSEEVIQQLIKDVTSSSDAQAYPYYFMVFLTLMASFQVYPEDLIHKCFEPSFQRLILNDREFPVQRHLLTLHSILTLDCHPKYHGKLLTDNQVNSASNSIERKDIRRLSRPPKFGTGTLVEYSLQQMFHQSKKAFGEDRVVYAFILPYSEHPFIVVLPEGQDSYWLNSCRLESNSMKGAHVLNVKSMTHFADTVGVRYRAYYATQIRLLEKLGIVVHNFHWTDLSKPGREFPHRLQRTVNNKIDTN